MKYGLVSKQVPLTASYSHWLNWDRLNWDRQKGYNTEHFRLCNQHSVINCESALGMALWLVAYINLLILETLIGI